MSELEKLDPNFSHTFYIYPFQNGVLSQEAIVKNVIHEAGVILSVPGLLTRSLMTTPLDLKALCVGYLFAEGIIHAMEDIAFINDERAGDCFIEIELTKEAKARAALFLSEQKILNPEQMIEQLLPLETPFEVRGDFVNQVVFDLHAKQRAYQSIGAIHAAGIFDQTGQCLGFAEDVSRHHALNKTIGKALLKGHDLKTCALALSCRVSFEFILRAARLGISLIATITSPTSLAIITAQRAQITLCGFVRDNGYQVYSNPSRIKIS